jgi:hypothetical protein
LANKAVNTKKFSSLLVCGDFNFPYVKWLGWRKETEKPRREVCWFVVWWTPVTKCGLSDLQESQLCGRKYAWFSDKRGAGKSKWGWILGSIEERQRRSFCSYLGLWGCRELYKIVV